MRRIFLVGLLAVMGIFLFSAGVRWGWFVAAERIPEPDPSEEEVQAPVQPEPEEEPEPEPEPEPQPEPDLRTVNLIAAGDITAHLPQITQAHIGDGKYDFSPSFEIIAPHLQAADLVVGNLETCQAGTEISFLGYQGYTGYPCFNAPIDLSVALKEAGFDLVATAHNHSMDRGLAGLKATLENIRSVGLTAFGTHLSEQERDTPVIAEVNGVNIGFLAYTFSTNVIPVPQGHEYAVNFIEDFHTLDPIIDEIGRATDAGADLVAVYMHWGPMYVTEPPPHLRDLARDLATAGADLILGGHPHVTQPMEWFHTEREDGSTRVSLATYSMGNFLSNQRYPANPTDLVQYGKILKIEITKDMDRDETWISDVGYDITWVHRLWGHRILSLSEVLAGDPSDFNLDPAQIEELRLGYLRHEQIIGKYGFFEGSPETRGD